MSGYDERLTALYEISRSLQTLDLEEVLRLILDGVTKTIGFDRARLYLVDEKEGVLKCRMAVGVDLDLIDSIVFPLEPESSVVARAACERRPYIIRDALNDPRVNKEVVEKLKIKSFVAVPMIGRERVVGVISADNLHSQREITEEDFKLLVTFVNQAGVAIENAEMYEELKELNRSLEERVREAMRELEESHRQLMQSEKLAALGRIAAGIAHELRNPLSSIKILFHSLVEEFGLDEKRPEDVEVMRSQIERMEELIRRFLDFARPSAPLPQWVDLSEVVENTVSLLEHQMRGSDISLRMELAPGLVVFADRDHLRQMIFNLTLNAVQAMPEGGELRIRTERLPGEALVEISDTGEGIPEEIMDRIFEPFFSTKEEGIGLGLSIVERIVKEHKGRIEVESSPGKGATFRVYLPIEG